jgi:hypothetical protein
VARRAGELIGVVGHAWSGTLLIQADAHPGELAVAAARHTGRRVTGLLGESGRVAAAGTALGLEATPAMLDAAELLMALSLDQLAIP